MGNVQDRFSTNKQVTLLKNYGTTLGIMSSATFTTTYFTSATTLLPTNTTPVFRGLNIFGSLHATDSVTATNTVTTTHLVANTVRVTGATTSTNTLTGAVVVTGGVGIGGSIYIGGSNNTVSSSEVNKWIFLTPLTTSSSRILTSDNGLFLTSNVRFVFPNWVTQDSGKKKFLYAQQITDGKHEFRTAAAGAGNVTWVTGFTLDNVQGTFNVPLYVTTVTNATSTNTGALQVTGGVGIGGDLWVGGDIVANKLTIQYTTVTTVSVQTDDVYTTFNSTPSTSTSTGAMVVAGGIGVNLGIFVGGTVTATSVVVTNLTATNLLAVSFTATDITATSLTSTNATFVSFTSTDITATSLTATNATITGLTVTNTLTVVSDLLTPKLSPTPVYFTGTIVGTILTVTDCPDGQIAWEQSIEGPGVAPDTFIITQLTGTSGGNGTYSVTVDQNVGPVTMNVAAVYVNGSLKLGVNHAIYQQDEDDATLYNFLIGIEAQEATIHIGDINTNGVCISNDKEYKVHSALNTGTFMAVAKVNTVDDVLLSSGNSSSTQILVGGMGTGYGMKLFNGGKTHIVNNLKIGDNTNDSIFAAPLEVGSRLQNAINNLSSPGGIGLPTYRGTATIVANDEYGSYVYGSRYRGTINTPTPVQDGDWLMEFGATAFDGTNNNGGGEMAFRVDGSVTGSANPSRWELYVTPAGTNSQTLGLKVDSTLQVTAYGTIKTVVTTATSLPSAVTAGIGARAFITDASTTTFNAAVVGGGLYKMPVFSDGTGWYIG
jgi:hypothetical protein